MRILLVEDDPVQAGVLGLHLLQAGHSVSTASGGVEAISLVRTQTFEIILMDLNMPGMSGLDTLALLMSDHLCSQTPIIMLTASEDLYDVRKARALGAAGYIEKPCAPLALLQKVERVVSVRDTRWIDDYHAVLTLEAGRRPSEIGLPSIVPVARGADL
jgi:CheY-like chemotaxis protein